MEIPELHKLFLEAKSFTTDTRKIAKDAMFFAFKGENFNGNQFAKEAIEKGAKYVIVDEEKYHLNSGKTILVKDVLSTLQELANFHRKEIGLPIIGITGSNGKTTTKELVKSVLSQKYKVFATEGNLNNHIGVPLSLLSLNSNHEMAIIEMGANHQKEIELLCRIAEPNFGLITNIGKAHLEGFGGEEGVFKGKTEMFDFLNQHEGFIFLNTDDEKINRFNKLPNTFQYGTQGKDITGRIEEDKPFLKIAYSIDGEDYSTDSNLIGTYNFSNILAAISIGKYFNLSPQQIKNGVEGYVPTNNRSQIIQVNKNKIILDAYNANPSSVTEAINNLDKTDGDKKIAVLGDMLELGDYSLDEHSKIVNLLSELKINALLIGDEYQKVNQNDFMVFKSSTEAGEYMKHMELQDYIILLKGSRGIKVEKVLDYLS